MDNIKFIADHYGLDTQLDKAIEENAELIVAIQKLKWARKSGTLAEIRKAEEAVVSELADVYITSAELRYLMEINHAVNTEIDRKIERQLWRIEEGK